MINLFLTGIVSINLTGKPTQILLIAGSYTGKTSSQLDGLFRNHQVEKVELNVQNLLEGRFGR